MKKLENLQSEIARWFNKTVDEVNANSRLYAAVVNDVASRMFARKLNTSFRIGENFTSSLGEDKLTNFYDFDAKFINQCREDQRQAELLKFEGDKVFIQANQMIKSQIHNRTFK